MGNWEEILKIVLIILGFFGVGFVITKKYSKKSKRDNSKTKVIQRNNTAGGDIVGRDKKWMKQK